MPSESKFIMCTSISLNMRWLTAATICLGRTDEPAFDYVRDIECKRRYNSYYEAAVHSTTLDKGDGLLASGLELAEFNQFK